MEVKFPAWLPPRLLMAFLDLRVAVAASSACRARLVRLVTDERLRAPYTRLDGVLPTALAWRAFLDVCDDAAWAAARAPLVRAARTRLRRQRDRIHALTVELSALLGTVNKTTVDAAVVPAVELSMLPELIERAAGGNALYEELARDHVDALFRISERALPSPAAVVAAIGAAAAEANAGPDEPVNDMLERAAASQKHVSLRSFVRAFDLRSRQVEVLRPVRLTHAELVAVGCAALGLPDRLGRLTPEDLAQIYWEAVRAARRGGGGFSKKRQHQSTIPDSELRRKNRSHENH